MRNSCLGTIITTIIGALVLVLFVSNLGKCLDIGQAVIDKVYNELVVKNDSITE